MQIRGINGVYCLGPRSAFFLGLLRNQITQCTWLNGMAKAIGNVFGGNMVIQLAHQRHYVLMYGLYSS
jgi:hypothetical protein